ncbi:unnamed protein product [Thelazia callipaeda]|uniref:EB1 C-terminal domain-containing protein n=1 Tax=Thelazia callipaeda TaxID=103827 RepID=A0A0N5CK93_THECL|nr:unnamed protein product [Thelazia callipaeda]
MYSFTDFPLRKSDQLTDNIAEKSDKRFSRPNILQLPSREELSDEWYEMGTTTTPSNDGAGGTDCKTENEITSTSTTAVNEISGMDQMDLEPDHAAEIEALEQSLTALLDDFRSGRMCACKLVLGEERLKMMREARQEMEDLTAFHVKLHKIQAPSFSTLSDSGGLDEQYDLLFRKLDNLHGFL